MRTFLTLPAATALIVSAPALAAPVFGGNVVGAVESFLPDSFSMVAGETARLSDDGLASRNTPVVTYSNLIPPNGTLRGFASTDVNARFGDDILMTQGGLLSTARFSVLNASAAPQSPQDPPRTLTGFTANLSFFDGPTGAGIGGFNVNFANLATPLGPGQFTTFGVSGIEALNIVLPQDVIVVQQLSNRTGTATSTGVVSFDPVDIGSAVPQLFIQASTVGGGAAGFYNITSGGVPVPFFMGLELGIIPEPTSLALIAGGGLVLLRRRRA